MKHLYQERRELFKSPALSFLAFNGKYTHAVMHELRILTSEEGVGQPLNFYGLRPLTQKESRFFSVYESPSVYGLGLSLSENLAPEAQLSRLQSKIQHNCAEDSIRALFNHLRIMNPDACSLFLAVPPVPGRSIENGFFLHYKRPLASEEREAVSGFNPIAGDIHQFNSLSDALLGIWKLRDDK